MNRLAVRKLSRPRHPQSRRSGRPEPVSRPAAAPATAPEQSVTRNESPERNPVPGAPSETPGKRRAPRQSPVEKAPADHRSRRSRSGKRPSVKRIATALSDRAPQENRRTPTRQTDENRRPAPARHETNPAPNEPADNRNPRPAPRPAASDRTAQPTESTPESTSFAETELSCKTAPEPLSEKRRDTDITGTDPRPAPARHEANPAPNEPADHLEPRPAPRPAASDCPAQPIESVPERTPLSVPLSLADFARTVDPGLEWTPFHRAYYRTLDAFAHGRVRRLIVTVPPQHGKSQGASILLPAYLLGLDPDLRVAIAAYSSALASRFNRHAQRVIDSAVYASLFPQTTVKGAGRGSAWVRTAERVEIVGCRGELLSVGREGPLTGNRVDVFILDDLYKDALEADSPIVRDNCWDWYTSVVRTRQHNDSRELIVFTRWHDEDLVGRIARTESVEPLVRWDQLSEPREGWLHLNLEALKETPPTEIDPRGAGEPLWPERHGGELLRERRRLDPVRFECLYQGRPSPREGLLYGDRLQTYRTLPDPVVRRGNYTDTADTGDDYLCSISYAVDGQGTIFLTGVVYSREAMEETEPAVAALLAETGTRQMLVESNNGGRGFARAIARLAPGTAVEWFHQSGNKEARILSHASLVTGRIRVPEDWRSRWGEFAAHVTAYRRSFRANRWHDAPDALTGIVEHECADELQASRILAHGFLF